MRTLIVAFCLIPVICAHHGGIHRNDFDVVIDEIEYNNIPDKYELKKYPIKVPKSLFEKITKTPRAGTEAILNDYADKIFTNLHDFMIHEGLDPVEMPDMHTGFNYTLIITYHGELDLTGGWLQDISTMHRGGDVLVTYSSNTKYLLVTVPIKIDDIDFSYDYSAKIMGLGPVGGIEGKVDSIGVEVTLGFNITSLEASLDTFYITDAGRITFHFNGNPLVDWLINLLTDVVTVLLGEVVLLVVENVIRGGLESVVDIINSAIGGFLNPTTLAPATTVATQFFN